MEHKPQIKLATLFRQNKLNNTHHIHEIKQQWLEYKVCQQKAGNSSFLLETRILQLDELI